MKSAVVIGVVLVLLSPLILSSLSVAGDVTITIKRGFNPSGLLSHVGYTVILDNTIGNTSVNFVTNVTNHYLRHSSYIVYNETANPGIGFFHSEFQLPFPALPYKITIDVTTNTSTNLSLSRTGIVLFNCYIIFIKGNETVTGPS